MKVFLRRKNGEANASGEYDEVTGQLTVLKGSVVSSTIHRTEKFRGANTIEMLRNEYVVNGKVKENVVFKSASTAANFITGSSTNGLTAWKNADGKTLREIKKGND